MLSVSVRSPKLQPPKREATESELILRRTVKNPNSDLFLALFKFSPLYP